MIDAPDRKEPRFPADKEAIAAKAIAAKLDELKAGPDDLALCGGACGGDLLFAEACLERGARLELRLAFDEPTFLQKSVAFAGDNWVERYFKVKSNDKTRIYVMPDELGPTRKTPIRSPATISGNFTLRCPGDQRRCALFVFGTARAATALAAHSTCTRPCRNTRAGCMCSTQPNFGDGRTQ